MMPGAQDDSDKTQDPTQHKLDEARKKGEVARSADLNTAGSYAGLLLAALTAGGASIERVGTALRMLIGQPGRFADLVFDGGAAAAFGGLLATVILGLLLFFLLPAAIALLSVVAQRAFVVAPEKLKPKLSRIDPVQNAKQKYGPSGLFEFGKNLAKLLLFSAALGLYIHARLPEMGGALHTEPRLVSVLMGRMMIEFLALALLIALAIGGVDFAWQHHDHHQRNRMSHRELRDEHKQHEGDPHMKQERRARGLQVASAQMMAEVPKADVIVMNPTHYAIALKWTRAPGTAPVCVAKGMDHIALAIRDAALEHAVPVRHDPPTARALYSVTEIGQEIDTEQYRAVAAAIRFADAMRRKARAR